MGKTRKDTLRVSLDRTIKLTFHGPRVSSDTGLFPCRDLDANQVRRQRHVLAYNLGNFLRRRGSPASVKHWMPTTLLKKLIEIEAKVVRHVMFQLAEAAARAACTGQSCVAPTGSPCTCRRLRRYDRPGQRAER